TFEKDVAHLIATLFVTLCRGSLEKGFSPMRFTHHLYNVTIQENSAPKTYVKSTIKMGIVIMDKLWDIKYRLVGGDDDNIYETKSRTVGDFCFLNIRTRSSNPASLNREVRDSYTLTVEATESVYKHQARTKVSVRVLDANDLKPLFFPASYYVDIKEDIPVRASVTTVSATDADLGRNGEFYYVFNERDHPFAVDPFTGTIALIKKLDYSQAQKYDLAVLAEDRTKKISGIRKFGNTARVVVNVEKTPPKAPLIKAVSVTEPSSVEDGIVVNVAVEDGEKRVDALSIVAGDSQKNFEIIPSSLEGHNFQIVSTKRINWSQSPFGFNLSLQAKDRSNPPLLSQKRDLHIPSSDPGPLSFEKEVYHATISEFAPPKSHVVRVQVIGGHSNITYAIKSNRDSHKFHINAKTGLIETTESLDFERKSQYEFNVVANRGGTETRVVIQVIDENDNNPLFTQSSYQGTLPENVPVGTSVLTVTATDRDTNKNGFVSYAIANTVPLPFTVDPFTGVISTSEALDYELMQRWYHLRVWAFDSGLPFSRVSECAVALVMSNINDNVPVFERVGCNATIPRDLVVGSKVGVMSAVDLDELEQVRYRIESGNEHGLFEINPVSGSITLAKKIHPSLFASGMPSFVLTITATDGKHRSSPATVKISVANPGQEASMHCEETGIFKELTERLIKSIKPDANVQEEDYFSDVHIINRHSPKFNTSLPSSIDLREDFPLNSSILHFQATDDDTGFNSKLVYAISSGNEDGCFAIDMESGDLKLACPLDREVKAFYVLNITVYDLGTPQKSVWKFLAVNILDVNDNPPRFDQSRYVVSIPENAEIEKSIFQAHAVDDDLDENGSVKYALLSPTENFKIDQLTGEVKVTGHLDREACSRYDLRIEARDEAKVNPQLFSVTDLVVVLQDINDNPPRFMPKVYKVQVPEDVPIGTVLLWTETYDFDLGPGGEISYNLKNNEKGTFSLETLTGALTLEKELDFETKQVYNLTVRAVDHGQPRSLSSSCFVEVEVLDVNENLNAPMFSDFVFNGTVMENAMVGTSVLTLSATDLDPGRDGTVRFHIHDGTGLGMFTIDEETGVIRTADTLDRETTGHYWLTVSAMDLGTVPLVSWTEVYLEVWDVNDNPPELSQPVYFGSVLENSPRDQFVLQVAATDADSSSEDQLSFRILDTQRTFFAIDSKTGERRVRLSLQPHTPSSTPCVLLKKHSSGATPIYDISYAALSLCIWMSSSLWLSVTQHSPLALNRHLCPHTVCQCCPFPFTGNTDGAFRIDPHTGSITVAESLDNPSLEHYHLNVKATDQGFPQRSDLCPVNVHVKLSENTSPKFFSSEYFAEVRELSPSGTPLLTISASSPSAMQYTIQDGDPNGTFHINSYSGVLSVKGALNFEAHTSYKLQIRASTLVGASSDAMVYIYVVDENDNPPVFLKDEFVGQISESAPVNSMVMREDNTPLVVHASDADTGSNSLLVYQIIEPEMEKVFQVDPNMGTISIISPVDFELTPELHFHVQVRDSGVPSLYAAKPAKVTVHILDFNDCPPRFTMSVYESSILFPAVRGMEVIQVSANDPDSDISYSIYEGNTLKTFTIDSFTGVISINNTSSLKLSHQLLIKASDGLYKDTTLVKVNVTNITETSLRFEQKFYAATVMENTTVVQILQVVRASGSYLNEPLIYSVLNPDGMFSMVQTSGVLETTGIPFDREEQDEYDVMVEVRDMRTPPRVATTHVKVYVEDANDNVPEFLNAPYFVTISDDAEQGDVLFQVTAVDKDLGENGSVIYLLEDDYSLFRIDPYLGDISLQRSLDFESMNKYDLNIFARDEGEPSLMSVAEIHIQVRNRSNPIFQSPLYRLKIPENIVPFTTILHVQARNPEGYRLIYNLVEENASKNFHIDFKTGVLTVAELLDYEIQSSYTLTVRATDSVMGSFSEATVEIEVEDINDNVPTFSKMAYLAGIPEGMPVSTSVLQISATDKDSGRNKELFYQIMETGKNKTDFFEINPVSGVIMTTQVLDHEAIPQHHLKVRATDNGVPPMSSEALVIVNVTDVNDNPPSFSEPQYQATLSEMATCGHIVIKIQASDVDSTDNNNLEYKIVSGNEDRHFAINKSSGLISFSNVCSRSLDPFYNLTVAVSDGVFQKTAPVNIDMVNSNKHSPYFNKSMYEAELAENAEAGTRVIRLAAIDPDDGPYGTVDYTIINKLADEKFSIDNKGQIVTTQPLDRENQTQRVIAIKVMAKDGGGKVAFCTVKIILTDVNDNPPEFHSTEYQVSIQSSVNKGAPVIQIMAYDADDGMNADVTYTVDEAEKVTEEVIEINPFTGVVSVKESLVGLENKIFNFKVKARDGGLPFYNTTVPVQVQVVPPEVPLPRFTEPLYTFSASEDLPLGSEVGTVKADADMPIIYSLVDGNTIESNKEKVFTVDKDSGTLLIQKKIDHEKTKWYQIDVMAQCNHNGTDVASLVSVSIQVQDVNDNQPVFEANPYKAFLPENMPPGTTVIQVTANDPDTDNNGEVTYRLEPEPDDISELFTIDSDSGWITTLKEMDCEAVSLYRFHVVATDQGGTKKLSSSTLVEIRVTDENDNPPHFTEDVYQGFVLENSRAGEVIVTVSTTDADLSWENRQVTCYITDGDPQGLFAMEKVGDEWQVLTNGALDREAKDKHSLKITATDGRFQASAAVDVHVLDVNDNNPSCEQLLYTEVVMENSPSGLFILKVSATDPDVGTNGQVTFTLHGPNADKFHLDPHTGELFTLAMLDRERDVEFDLVAKATDGGGRSCQADILLMVQDMNDNAPRFSSSHYAVTVFDNTTVRTPIAVIYAKDPDAGINGEVVYSLLGSDSSYFSLDEYSGILRLEKSLADEPQTTFELKVQATDRGLPRRMHSVATVAVTVVDLSDYQPVFLSSEYSAQIPESTAIGTEVLSVSAFSKDNNMPILYDVIAGNEHGMFQIDPETGVLTVNGSLDFEQCREYYLSVEGTRSRSSLSDVAMVIINITDVNDNSPTFGRGDYSAEVSEDVSLGNLVIQVTAVDSDGPLNNLVHYTIVSGDPRRQFNIDAHSGEIRTSSRLDREEVTHYSLTIQAADRGDPPLSTAVQVTITVLDVNDNAPTFSQTSHSLVLQEGEPIGSGVLQLSVMDRDTPANGPPFSYHIVSGNEDRRFHIDQGGLLSTAGQLRKRSKAQYLLKIQVTDDGHPPLSSICVVKINITEQSRFPPSAVPLEVFITVAGRPFSRRVIGRLHASDQDLHDVLSYELVSEAPASGRFSVDGGDGKVVAEGPLEPGLYILNVSVSDGRLSTWAAVRVHVWGASQRALDQGVTLHLTEVSPEEFVADHWRALQRGLSASLGVPRQELHVASLQPSAGSRGLEVLLVRSQQDDNLEPQPAALLDRVAYDVGDAMGLTVAEVRRGACVTSDCRQASCRNTVRLVGETESQYATARTSFITPQHSWESVCSCNDSAMRFEGRGYLKYLYQERENRDFRLALRMKTSQTNGVVVSADSTDWATLELVNGGLRFRYTCGKGAPQILRAPGDPVSDGRWHHVLLEVNSTGPRLTLDHVHTASATSAEPCLLGERRDQRGSLLFAAPREAQAQGFLGCLDELEFNKEALRGSAAPEVSSFGERRVFGRYQCCPRTEGCASGPCLNGGSCQENPVGEVQCVCPSEFSGPRCEVSDCSQQDDASRWVSRFPVCIAPAGSCLDDPDECSTGHVQCKGVHVTRTALGIVEIAGICGGLLCLLMLVGGFVWARKSYVQHRKDKAAATAVAARDSGGFLRAAVGKGDGAECQPLEMREVGGSGNDLDHDLFRTLKSQNTPELGSLGAARGQRPSGPVVCSVAPNLPPPPPSSSDNESIVKNNWELDYDVYPADPDYFGRPTVQEFPQFDIVEDTFPAVTAADSRRNSRFGGFPFPLERCDRRAPLPPCYSNQNLDDFLGPDGRPLPAPQCPNEYTAISYYPTQHARSLDNVSGGYRRLSVRLSVAQPSYAECSTPPLPPAPPSHAPRGRTGSDMVESDYGSCEEVMF
uniref:FAT atypical cadherin 2 n=1 Tax=Scleropages formosus TaxID=113540 RepID=A0A8C9UXP7_SCLFO